ncbi:MyfA/PsaA family fimbrial adhesin [Yersinia enterocolitica]
MKEFAKKSLAIAVLMMTFGGGAHATVVGSKEVQARKTVERVDVFSVEFNASANKVSEGEQSVDTNVFTLKMSETAPHTEWAFFQFHHQKWMERLLVLWLM